MSTKAKKTFVTQVDQSDCGIACLMSLINYHGGNEEREKLRQLSGTTERGTTMLGLYQSALKLGFKAEGFEADIAHLKDLEVPVILHTHTPNKTQHYVVYYGHENGKYLIGNPDFSIGVHYCSEKELEEQWVSKKLLLIEPTKKFKSFDGERETKWSWFMNAVKEDLSFLTIASVLGVVISLLGLATAVFSQRLFDQILPEENFQKLNMGIALLCFLLVARSFLNYLRNLFLLQQSKDFNKRIMNYFYSSIIRLPLNFFENRKVGELIARMNDTRRIQNTISFAFGVVIIDALIILSTVLFVFFYSNTVGVMLIISLVVFALLVVLYDKKIHSAQFEVMRSYALNESNYIDTVEGVETIKNYGKEPYFSTITKTIYDFFQDRIYNLGRVRVSFNLVAEILASVLIVLILSVGSYLVLNEYLSIGEMVALISLVGSLIPSINRMANANIQIQEAKVAFNRMYEFTSINPEYLGEGREVLDFDELSVKNISFAFPGRLPLLNDISFSLKVGEHIAILGDSGTGKSTTLKILTGHYNISEGAIEVNGMDLSELNLQNWRSMVGVVTQDTKIFNGSIIDNICLDEPEENKDKVITFCKNLGFDTFFEKFPEGYYTRIGEDGVNISGGQTQLVVLARALYSNPKVLLLDEPSSAMDRNTEKFVFDLLEGIKKKVSVVLVTHRIKTARNSDCIYILDNGKIQDSGTHEDLISKENLYSNLYKEMISS